MDSSRASSRDGTLAGENSSFVGPKAHLTPLYLNSGCSDGQN